MKNTNEIIDRNMLQRLSCLGAEKIHYVDKLTAEGKPAGISYAQLLNFISPILQLLRITIMPVKSQRQFTKFGDTNHVASVRLTVKIVNIDNPRDYILTESVGFADANTDKHSVISAETVALKMAIIKFFNLGLVLTSQKEMNALRDKNIKIPFDFSSPKTVCSLKNNIHSKLFNILGSNLKNEIAKCGSNEVGSDNNDIVAHCLPAMRKAGLWLYLKEMIDFSIVRIGGDSKRLFCIGATAAFDLVDIDNCNESDDSSDFYQGAQRIEVSASYHFTSIHSVVSVITQLQKHALIKLLGLDSCDGEFCYQVCPNASDDF